MIQEESLIQAAGPIINTLLTSVIAPKIKEFAKKFKLKYKELMIPQREHFEEYLYRSYKKYSIINTLVFKNEQRLIKDIYIPLTLIKENHQRSTVEQAKIEDYPSDLINKYNKILITDTAGMGKSTLTKHLFLEVLNNGYGIPVYIEMRRLEKRRPILKEIQEQINSLTKPFDKDLLLDFINTGDFVFFLDGYDEISLENRSAVTTDVQDFISKAGNNVFIMTSRPEQALTSFGDFQVFTIQPLAKKEAYELLRKYDNHGSTSKHLIGELNTGKYEMINEFLKNPLLVSLLFAAFDYKQTIPLKKHVFYRQVYDAYFDSHDLSKGDCYIHDKCSKLDIDDFERILRYVGFKCFKLQKIEFEKDALLHIIKEAKDFCPDLSFSISDYFSDLLSAVPLFCKDGQYYKWVHKSLQEYFAAQFIFKDAKSKQDEILNILFNSEKISKYINLLDIYYDIDNMGFRKNILSPLCQMYIDFYNAKIFTSDIISKNDIENRIGWLFMHEFCIKKRVKRDIEDENLYATLVKEARMIMNHEEISVLLFPARNIIMYEYCDPKSNLLHILSTRMTSLFRQINRDSNKTDKIFTNDTLVYVDQHTGEENYDIYKLINSCLNIRSVESFILDYNSCVKIVNEINKSVCYYNDTNDLLDGI